MHNKLDGTLYAVILNEIWADCLIKSINASLTAASLNSYITHLCSFFYGSVLQDTYSCTYVAIAAAS